MVLDGILLSLLPIPHSYQLYVEDQLHTFSIKIYGIHCQNSHWMVMSNYKLPNQLFQGFEEVHNMLVTTLHNFLTLMNSFGV